MKTQYDPDLIQKFADALYRQAQSLVTSRFIVGLLVGGALGAAASAFFEQEQTVLITGVSALLFAWLGYSSAQARAYSLRLQAQEALCRLQIEKNTRREPLPGTR